MKAIDIMTSDVITVIPEDTIEKVARLLLEHKISGLPVTDGYGKIIGIISEGDLVRQGKKLDVPSFTEILGGVIFFKNPRIYIEELRRLVALQVGDLMSRDIIMVKPAAPIEDVAALMVDKHINRVPVVDDGGILKGIISRQDLIRAIQARKAGNES